MSKARQQPLPPDDSDDDLGDEEFDAIDDLRAELDAANKRADGLAAELLEKKKAFAALQADFDGLANQAKATADKLAIVQALAEKAESAGDDGPLAEMLLHVCAEFERLNGKAALAKLPEAAEWFAGRKDKAEAAAAEFRRQARNKLTPEERESLGIA